MEDEEMESEGGTSKVMDYLSSTSKEWKEEEFLDVMSGELTDDEIDVILKHERKAEFLKSIISRNRLKLLEQLINNTEKFTDNVSLELWNELFNLSAEYEFFEIYQKLKTLESKYEEKLNESRSGEEKDLKQRKVEIDYEYKNVLDDISMLHSDISEGRVEEIRKFNAKYPKLKLCYGTSENCALERSIDSRQFHVYAFLRANGFYTDKGQKLNFKIKTLDDDEKEQIHDEVLKFTMPDPIGLILSKCYLDAPSDVLNFQDIRQMLNELIKVEEIKPVLEILAQSDVTIIFDFKNDVTKGDPNAGEYVLDYANFRKGLLYIGNQSRAQRFGTFVREATHFSLFLLYENSCLPYRKEDEERERIWEEILRNIVKMYLSNPNETNNIIKWIHNADCEQTVKLIVKVNELLAFYYDNPQKCEEVRETYRELFDFYRNFVLPDLNMKNAYKIIKLNNDFKLFEEIINSKFQVRDSETFHLLEYKENVQKLIEDLIQGNLNEKELQKFTVLTKKLQSFDSKKFILISNVPQLTLSKLFKEIYQKSLNKLDPKVKNIFINFGMLQQISLKKELENILISSTITRLIIYIEHDFDRKYLIKEFLKFLSDISSDVQIFLIATASDLPLLNILNECFHVEDSNAVLENGTIKIVEKRLQPENESSNEGSRFLKVTINHSWEELSVESKEYFFKNKPKFENVSEVSHNWREKMISQTFRFFNSQNKSEEDYSESFEMENVLDLEKQRQVDEMNKKFELIGHLERPKIVLTNLEELPQLSEESKQKLLCYTTNLPQALLHSFYSQLISENPQSKHENLFIDSALLMYKSILNDFQNFDLPVKNIFVDTSCHCNEEILNIIMQSKIFLQKKSKKIFFFYENSKLIEVVKKSHEVEEIKKSYKWSNLTERTQQILNKRRIKFQNQQVRFEEIFKSNLDDMPSEMLQTLCSDQQLEINSREFSDDTPRIERKFQIKENVFYCSNNPQNIQNLFYSENISFDELFEKVKDKKIISLADERNSGKTIAFDQIYRYLFERKKIVKLISLDKEINAENFNAFLASKINDDEKFSFYQAYNEGNAIILIDEIKEFNELVKSGLQNWTRNQIWITSNVQIGNEIENFLQKQNVLSSYVRIKLAVAKSDEISSFLEKYKDTSNTTDKSNLDVLINKLKEYFDLDSVSILAEIIQCKIKLEEDTISIATACKKLYDLFVNEWNQRNGEEFDINIFRFLALKCHFPQEEQPFGLPLYVNHRPEDYIWESKIIQRDKNGNAKFKNAFWIDYFVADFFEAYFNANLESSEIESKIVKFFVTTLTTDNMKNARKILNQMLLCDPQDNYSRFEQFSTELKNTISTLNGIKFCKNEQNFKLMTLVVNALKRAYGNNDEELNKLIFEILVASDVISEPFDNCKELYETAFSESFDSFVVNWRDNYNKYFYHYLFAKTESHKIIDWILIKWNRSYTFIKDNLNIENFYDLINGNNIELLKSLLCNIDYPVAFFTAILEYVLEKEKLVFYEPIKMIATSKFENSFNFTRYEKFFAEISNLHTYIQNSQKDDAVNAIVRIKSDYYQGLIYFKNKQSCCAIDCALYNFEILKSLLEMGLRTDNKNFNFLESLYLDVSIDSSIFSEEMRKHLLLAKIQRSTTSTENHIEELSSIVEDLLKYDMGKDVLMNIALTDYKIIVTNEPNLNCFGLEKEWVGACFSHKNALVICRSDDKASYYGTVIHEATHAAMVELYNNNGKPYREQDTTAKEKYENIVEQYHNNELIKRNYPILAKTYEYTKDKIESELIVRLLHLIAHDIKSEVEKDRMNLVNDNLPALANGSRTLQQIQNDVTQKVRNDFPDLYNFYNEFTLKDLKIIDGIELRSMNDEFGLWKQTEEVSVTFVANNALKLHIATNQIIVFKTQFPVLLFKYFFDHHLFNPNINSAERERNYLKIKSANLFIDYAILEANHMFGNKFNRLVRSGTVERVFIDFRNKEIFHDVYMRLQQTKKKIYLINTANPNNFTQNISFSLPNINDGADIPMHGVNLQVFLTEASKGLILNTKVTFQSRSIKIRKIVDLNEINESILMTLISNEKQHLEINKIKNFTYASSYVERDLEVDAQNIDENDFIADQFKNVTKFYIISDKIGSGKTSTLKELYTKFVGFDDKNSFWTSFVSLKKFKNRIKEKDMETVLFEIEGENSLIEKMVFLYFRGKNKIALFADDFDILDKEEQRFFLELIKNPFISKVFIASQKVNTPYLINQIQDLKKHKKISIPFTPSKRIVLLKSLKFAEKFSDDVCKRYENIELLSFGFPLLARIVEKIKMLNLFNIMDSYHIDILHENWLTNVKENIETYLKKLLNYEYLHIQTAFENNFLLGLPFGKIDWDAKEITNYPSLCVANDDNLKFHYQIDQHFWIIKYLKKHLTLDNTIYLNEFLKLLFIHLSANWNTTFCDIFYDADILQSNEPKYRNTLETSKVDSAFQPVVTKFIKKIVENEENPIAQRGIFVSFFAV